MQSQLTKRGSGRELAIVLHGPHGSPEDMQGVSKALEERSKDIDILAPILPYGGFFGLLGTTPIRPTDLQVAVAIDKDVAARATGRGSGASRSRTFCFFGLLAAGTG